MGASNPLSGDYDVKQLGDILGTSVDASNVISNIPDKSSDWIWPWGEKQRTKPDTFDKMGYKISGSDTNVWRDVHQIDGSIKELAPSGWGRKR